MAQNDALRDFETREPEKARRVKLRYFAGLTTEQAAAALGIALATANRWWAFSCAGLHRRLVAGPS